MRRSAHWSLRIGGASGYLPEHTLGAYELALDMGVDYIEPDLQLSSDGALVAMHDDTLERTTNVAAPIWRAKRAMPLCSIALETTPWRAPACHLLRMHRMLCSKSYRGLAG